MARHAINHMLVFVVDLSGHRDVAHGCLMRRLGTIWHVTRNMAVVATDSERFVVAVHQSPDLAGGQAS
jgi:hypothetical protein